MASIQSFLGKVGSNKIVISFVAILMVAIIATTNAVSAAPDYFDVAKPSSTSQCYGSTTTYHWAWKWERHQWRHHSYWTGHWERVAEQTANWEKLGFSDRDQCLRYVSTAAPQTKGDCTQRRAWYRLGFNNERQCIRYARTHGGNGYGGNS